MRCRIIQNFLSVALVVGLTLFSLSFCSAEDTDETIIKDQFEKSKIELLPLSPEEIQAFKKRTFDTEQAIRNFPPPKMVSKTIRVSLAPGSEIPIVNVAADYVSSLVFYDITGQPWPVTSRTLGNDTYFDVNRVEVEPGNLLTVTPKTKYATTNCVITLQDHDLPVSLQLNVVDPQQKDRSTDGLIALQISQRGPNAAEPILGGDTIGSSLSNVMMGFVDAIAPETATVMSLSPEYDGINVWLFQKNIYIRSAYPLIWPAWDQTASGAGGEMKVYRLPEVPSVMLSINGQMETINLTMEGSL